MVLGAWLIRGRASIRRCGPHQDISRANLAVNGSCLSLVDDEPLRHHAALIRLRARFDSWDRY